MKDGEDDGLWDKRLFFDVFVRHILADIRFCADNERYLAAAQLLLSGIDTAAGLTRPLEQEDTTRADFIGWANAHLALEGPNYKLTGLDIYAAHCGFLDGYTPLASLISKGVAKAIAWVDSHDPPVLVGEDKTLVLVSLRSLCAAYGRAWARR